MKTDLSKIIRLIDEILDAKDAIALEIKKEKNARRRKKLKKASNKLDTAAIRKLWFDR